VNPYAVKYSLERAWVYSMLSIGLWTAYWFYVTRKLFDGETGRGRDDAVLHTLGKVNEFWDVRTQGLATEAPMPGAEKAVVAVGASFWVLCVLWLLLFVLLVALGATSSD
jgi:hypothetical protein